MYKDEFSRLHAFTIFFYYLCFFASTALTMHPYCIAAALIGVFCYAAKLSGTRFIKKSWRFLLPGIAAALINVLFNHRGITPVFSLPGGNKVTAEALAYGAAAAFMLIALCIGFYCFSKVFTSERLTELFARHFPVFTVILMMILRFVPLFVRRFRQINEAQTALGKGAFRGNIFRRFKNLAAIFTVLTGMSLEEAITTADSMKSRGYGIDGRRCYTGKRFSTADAVLTAFSAVCAAAAIYGAVSGKLDCVYYPRMTLPAFGAELVLSAAGFTLLAFLPLVYDFLEEIRWRSRISEI